MKNGSCRTGDGSLTGWFFPDVGDTVAVQRALKICIGCPVQRECFNHADSWNEDGVWGGTTEKERRRLRRMVKQGTRLVEDMVCPTCKGVFCWYEATFSGQAKRYCGRCRRYFEATGNGWN